AGRPCRPINADALDGIEGFPKKTRFFVRFGSRRRLDKANLNPRPPPLGCLPCHRSVGRDRIVTTESRIMLNLRKSGLVWLAFLANASLAIAGSGQTVSCRWNVYCEGVDRYGCLIHGGGECVSFYACLNTCTGSFIGKASGCVTNSSR